MDERPSGNAELFPCPDCGRSFISSALERHARICQSVFKGKKKPSETDAYAASGAHSFPSQQQQVAASSGKTGSRQSAAVAEPQHAAADRWDIPKQPKAAISSHGAASDANAFPAHKGSGAFPKSQPNSYDHQAALQHHYPPTTSSSHAVSEYPATDSGIEAETGPLQECPDCGRKFNMKAFEKHVKICQKVLFASKLDRALHFVFLLTRVSGVHAEAQSFQCYRGAHARRGAQTREAG
jgi:predicted RNA-binding Zn-ribbon protein involved in translation (DUF1610 family)